MSKTLTASDRKNLIRLASSLPSGDKKRKAILDGLAQTKTAGSLDVWVYNEPGEWDDRTLQGVSASSSAEAINLALDDDPEGWEVYKETKMGGLRFIEIRSTGRNIVVLVVIGLPY